MMGIIYAILSAVVWGAGDFCGGLSTRRNSQFLVLLWISIIGSGLMLLAAWMTGEAWLSAVDIGWSALAGFSGAVGILALYVGLSRGYAALVSPVAAVLGSAIPLLISIFLEGFPAPLRLAGLLIAVPGIWQVSRSTHGGEGDQQRGGMGLAILAGAGFAGFFVVVAQVQEGQIFTPLIVSKLTAFLIGILVLIRRGKGIFRPVGIPLILLTAVLDSGGNVFFLLAEQNTRLDVASVLASMYAAVTVLLSQQVLKERVTNSQWLGIGLCLVAIAMIVA